MTDNERLAVLETKMESIAETMKAMVKDVKDLQMRWAMILGGVALVTNLPAIVGLLRGHP